MKQISSAELREKFQAFMESKGHHRIPSASVITTTVGALRSGKTSTSVWIVEYIPATRQMKAITSTATLLLSEKRMIPFRRPFSCWICSMA